VNFSIKFLTFLLTLFYITPLSAQHYNIKFKHIGIPEGLSNNHITDILQDEFGYMWIATERGLNRYDGHQMIVFPNRSGFSDTILDHHILDLERNVSGGIWIITKKGLVLYNNGVFQHKQIPNDPDLVISHAEIVANNNWFFSNNGIYSYDQDQGVFTKIQIVRNTDFKYSFINNTGISTAMLDAYSNQIWICTIDKGIYIKDRSTRVIRPYLLKPAESQAANNILVKNILLDNQGNIWFASNIGLWYKPHDAESPRKIEIQSPLINNVEVLDIEIDYKGKIWCAISDLGIIVLNGDGKIIEHFDAEDYNKTGLSSGFINQITFDKQNNLWLGHQDFGIDFSVTKFNQKIAYYKNLNNKEDFLPTKVKRILPLQNKKVLIAYESSYNPDISGLNIISTGQGNYMSEPELIQQIKLDVSDLDITELLSIDDQILVSTYDHIYTFDISLLDNKAPILNINPVSYTFDEYVMFHYLHQNQYWLLGQNLRTFDMSNQQEELFDKDLNLDRFIIDDKNLMWGAASHSGLVIIDMNKKEILHQYISEPLNEKSISDNNITCINKDSNGTIWIGTEFGLNKIQNFLSDYSTFEYGEIKSLLKNIEFQRFKAEDGLSGNSIKSIIEDNNKRLWLATDNGISMIDLITNNIFKLGVQEGIQNSEFMVNSYAQDQDGILYFGGEQGLVFFNPDSIYFEKFEHQIFINELKILNNKIVTGVEYADRIILEKNIESTEHIELDYKEVLIEIGFVTTEFEHPEEILYYYKLDGYDIDWIQSKNYSKASYTKVPPSEYTFRVKAQTANKHWTKEAQLKIIIHPPFWATWWFISLITLIAILLIIFYVRLRLRNIKKQKKYLENIVHERTKDLEKAYIDLQEHENEILLQRDQLQELNDKIKKSNALKLQFFTNISHELRTPLTLIMAPIERLTKSGGLSQRLQQKLSLINKNAHRLNQLINQLLQFRKIETGNQKIKAKKGDIIPFIINLSDQFLEYSQQAEIRYQLNCDHKSLVTWFDEDILYKIISNLLSNAFKYTPKGGSISMSVTCFSDSESGDEYLKIIVKDTGIGIEKNHLKEIFNRFYQREDSNIKVEGTGIGLSLTKSLVALHKGHITVNSELGCGSTFTIDIPLGEDYLEEDEKSFSTDGSITYDFDIFESIDYQNQSVYNIEFANNGEDALSIIKTNETIDLIISDVMMPVMDGLSFCNKVKTNINTSHIPVIILTAKHGDNSELEALKIGADDYITKPFNEKILRQKIQNTFAYRESLRNIYKQKISIEPSEITTTSFDQKFIDKAVKVVEENITDSEFDIKAFSSALAMSPSTLLRKIKAITGEPSDKFIRTIRLKRAAQLLRKSQFSITEICYEVGFSSQKHFSTTFKKYFELSPTEYKKNNSRTYV
jgi:signal transduction histidine kinase/ligand-binding sensor domain-containing protein/DNA-binding response OmpR family regulator